MSFKNNQNDTTLPTATNQLKSTVALLPRFFRTEANKKFLQSTIDQLVQPGVAEKINGYVGRKTAKAYKGSDNYLNEVSTDRQTYQFEPVAVIKDSLDNVTFYKDYNDYINQLAAFGADVSDHSKINSQDMYAWNPHIDWDKFVNFREYYWMPNGPQTVPVRARGKEVVKTYTVRLTNNDNTVSYLFTPDGKTANPTLSLYRGEKYRFEIDTPGHPMAFAISRTFTPGTAILVAGREGIRASGLYDSTFYGDNYDIGGWVVLPTSGSVSIGEESNASTLYPDGIVKIDNSNKEVTVVYVEKGTIEFTIPDSAPNKLFYISKYDINTSGMVNIYNIEESTQLLEVEKEIIGMKTYKSGNGIEFSNGMKVFFQGDVQPTSYLDGQWYVEGVGTKIQLVKESNLSIPAAYSANGQVPFDSQPFDTIPFSDASGYAVEKDYLVINRNSADRNPWSRYNKWIHRDVIEYSAAINNQTASMDQDARAKRPIIEFEAGLKLFNYGTYAKTDVDLVDNFTTDVFSTISGSIGYNVDGIDLVAGMRVLFTADTDSLVNGNIYRVDFIKVDNRMQISLVETDDTLPLELETVFVKGGVTCAGKTFHYTSGMWNLSQQKTARNQAPLFSLCCPVGNDYANLNIFDSTTFNGTKLFSYTIGDGIVDSELGFPLTYRTIENFGDIVFDFNLLSDTFTYQNEDQIVSVSTDTSNLRKYTSREQYTWVNAWSSVPVKSKQRVFRQYTATADQLNNFEIDTYANPGLLSDLSIIVHVNNQLQKNKVDYNIVVDRKKAYINFINDKKVDDLILAKMQSSAAKNSNGWYEFPINLEKNPLNEDIGQFTLGEVTDHVDSIIEEVYQFNGAFPGSSNLRDLGNISRFGKRFVKHSGPVNLPLYHITNKNYNIVNALRYSKREYSRFKRVFLDTANTLGYDGPIKQHVDKVLDSINSDKVITQPFYFSDMLGYNSASRQEFIVLDNNDQYYPLTTPFDLTTLSTRQVSVYLNGKQLLHGKQYEFTSEGFVLVRGNQVEDDIIEIFDYTTTDGSFIPPTPTKLGLYPAFEPCITIDDTYLTQELAADSILKQGLERYILSSEPNKDTVYKIYGQLDSALSYSPRGWFYPVYDNKSAAVKADKANGGTGTSTVCRFVGLNRLVYMPTVGANQGVEDNENYIEYPFGIAMIRGHDGSFIRAYKDYRDDLMIELETRIFNNIKIKYNTELLDINDFAGGFFRKTDYSKDQIDNVLLNDFIQWTNIVNNDYTLNDFYENENQFTYNYSSMSGPNGETLLGFWRGIYIQAFDTDRPHSAPWEILGFADRPDWWTDVYGPAPYTCNNLILWKDIEQGIIREPNTPIQIIEKYARPGLTNFIPVDEKGKLRSPLESNFAQNFFLRHTTQGFKFGDHAPVETAWRKSSEYPFALITAWVLNNPTKIMGLGFDLSRIEKNLAGQYIYADTGKILQLDKISFPNSYADTTKVMTSGLVNYIHNLIASNVLKVYNDYKTEVTTLTNQLGFKLAGFSEKEKLKLILDSRSAAQSSQGGVFVPFENYNVFLNSSSPIDVVVYSGVIIEKATGGFVVRGYSHETPNFSYYRYITSSADASITVGGISEITTTWTENKPYAKGQIIEYNNKFYRVTSNFTSGAIFSTTHLAILASLPVVGGKTAIIRKNFDKTEMLKLPYGSKLLTSQEVVDFILGYGAALIDQGFTFENFNTADSVLENWHNSVEEFLFWTTQGWAAGTTISMSPAARQLKFSRNYAVVDNLYDEFYDYSIFNIDGTALEPSLNTISRGINDFGITPNNANDGVYHARLPLIQKEHVVLLDNKTIFNDIVYQPTTGYRQDRIRVSGYRSDNWQGSLNIPGFMFDTAEITEWTAWQDYRVGQLVKHKQFYYVAKDNVIGQEIFADLDWVRLNEKPTPKLLTNFDYRINQFTDFYEVESDYFDEEQQRLAQHIIGYQKRTYLQNIITDDVSQFKFYQGFIRDKGTKNAITKLFDSITAEDHEGLEFYEEWAVQLGQYGSLDSYTQLELVINEKNMIESPQGFELVNQKSNDILDNTYRYTPAEIYSKPQNYNSDPFPTTDPREFILTAGYVNEKDVTYIVKSIDELLAADTNSVNINDYIWLTDDSKDGWNILQHADSIGIVNSLSSLTTLSADGYTQKLLILNDQIDTKVLIGEYISVRGAQLYNLTGFYRVDSAVGNRVIISVGNTNLIQDFSSEAFIMTKMRSVRIKDSNSLNVLIQQKKYSGQKVWIDDYAGQWAVLENKEVYSNQQVINNPSAIITPVREFGSSVSATMDNTTLMVSDPGFVNIKTYDNITESEHGKVYFYKRNRDISNLELEQAITLVNRSDNKLFDDTNSNFGSSISVSEDGNFLAVGISKASNVNTQFKGQFNSRTAYNNNDIVKYKERLWKAERSINATDPEITDEEYRFYTSSDVTVPTSNNISMPPSKNNKNYTRIYNISANAKGGTPSGITNQGAVAIYKKSAIGKYEFVNLLVSEHDNHTEFGTKVRISKVNNQYTLFVSSKGTPGFIETFVHGPTENDVYRGVWSSTTTYYKDEIVWFDSSYYKALTDISTQDILAIANPLIWENISWKVNKDENYVGEFDKYESYSVDDVIVYKKEYYTAVTNMSYGDFNPNSWSLKSNDTEFAGYMPGPTQENMYTSFGTNFDVSRYGDVLIAACLTTNSISKSVAVYRHTNNFEFLQKFGSNYNNNGGFAEAISISPNGTTIAVAEPFNDDIVLNKGKVYLYVFDDYNRKYIFNQTLISPHTETLANFGSAISLSNKNIAISSLNGDILTPTTFDMYVNKDLTADSAYVNDTVSAQTIASTTFDNGFTQFTNIQVDTGVVYIFENISNSMLYAEQLYNLSATMMFGETLLNKGNHVYAGTVHDHIGPSRIIDYRKPVNSAAWTIVQTAIAPVDTSKIHEIFLYNKRLNQVVSYLDFIDPIQGKIAGPAEQEIKYKVAYDPAKYTYGSDGIATTSTVDWGADQVGEVWWKLNGVKFANAYQGTMQYQKTEWNKILSGSVEVREWVESSLLPLDWDKIADTEKGLASGISGTSVFGNTNYCQRYAYDDVSKTFVSKYYYWVKNKTVVPNIKNRKLSISDVQKLIENPRLQGYRFISFLSSNRFILNNCESLISHDDIVLCIRYNDTDKLVQNIHNEYQIISDGLSTSIPHPDIEEKWFNSLIGFDKNNRTVPDMNLSVREKYGIQSLPRQSMFVNRNEALKQTIERINAVLSNYPIVDTYNISALLKSQQLPSSKLNLFDAKVNTIEELEFVSTNKVKKAELAPVIVNGKLIRVDIIDGGRGYKDLNYNPDISSVNKGPTVEVVGSGVDAEVEVELDSVGKIVKATVVSTGSGYNDNTIIMVRQFTALVTADSTSFGKWAMYAWNDISRQWFRTAVQEYDVRKFWNYVDWYAPGYNAFTAPKRTLAGTYQLDEQEDMVGDVIKINNIGTGGWVFLEKIANEITADYTINYKTVGRKDGTIQFTNMLYDYSKNTIGFDNRSFDSSLFDNVPSTELRIILETIRDEIFVSDLTIEYNQLFIAALRYVLSEQPYADWMFKTSFVKINHKIGELRKDITFNADNLANYQDYVNEVKPYSTTVREFISSYTALDNTNSAVSDFDLAPAYNSQTKSIQPTSITIDQNTVSNLPDDINTYPRKHWFDAHGYSVVDVAITDHGLNYNSKPTITFEGGGGSGAKATAYIGYGKITKIVVTDSGAGYTSAPTVIIGDAPMATAAKVTAIIGNGLVRTPKITMKYDRIAREEYYLTRDRIETFVGTNVNTVFDLNWPMNTERKNVAVYVDNQKLLKSEFTYTNIEHNDKTYSRQRGRIVFAKSPALAAEIRVNYIIATDLLAAIDRIRFEYNPTVGMPAIATYGNDVRDYSQLISGIDYGGVEIQGLGFGETAGWNSRPWSSAWNIPADAVTGSPFNYDVTISGGDYAYTTATGIAAEDIIIDGDKFLTPLTSGGPEELVPGQMFDTVSITVYTRSTDGNDPAPIFAFTQFKDMLNRTHYKRVDIVTPILAADLKSTDLQIVLDDASSLPVPDAQSNIPGIIFINGERIEYFVKNGNILTQLRRGTLGTSINALSNNVTVFHAAGSIVIAQDSTKTLPYRDITQTQHIIADGTTNTFVLEFDKIRRNKTYFNKDEFEVFVGGNRLKKNISSIYSNLVFMDSPEGDILMDAEFVIDNTTGSITLTQMPELNQRITIIRKIGTWWSDIGATLESSSSDVALFLKSAIS